MLCTLYSIHYAVCTLVLSLHNVLYTHTPYNTLYKFHQRIVSQCIGDCNHNTGAYLLLIWLHNILTTYMAALHIYYLYGTVTLLFLIFLHSILKLISNMAYNLYGCIAYFYLYASIKLLLLIGLYSIVIAILQFFLTGIVTHYKYWRLLVDIPTNSVQ